METAVGQRLAFDNVKLEHTQKARCVVLVALTESNKDVQVGSYEGDDTSGRRLECAAKATLQALESAAQHRVEFHLDLVRSLDSPHCVLVILSVIKPVGERKMQLCGTCLVDAGDPLHAATKAVLQATNRLFETDFIFFH